MAYLEVLNGPEVGNKAHISQDTFFIGRDPNNHLVLSDRTVSRKHAVLNQVEGRFVISDLKSLKGLLVNGSKRNEATLEDGDEIAAGAVRIRFYAKDDGRISLQKPRSRWLVGILLGALSIAALGIGYHFWSGKTNDLERHYLAGIELFNEGHDIEGAKREWQEVLKLDPKKKTPYAQKAAKLLETLP